MVSNNNMNINEHLCYGTNTTIDDIIVPETPPPDPNQYISIVVDRSLTTIIFFTSEIDEHDRDLGIPNSTLNDSGSSFDPIFPANTVNRDDAINTNAKNSGLYYPKYWTNSALFDTTSTPDQVSLTIEYPHNAQVYTLIM